MTGWPARSLLVGALIALTSAVQARAEEPRDVFYRLGPIEVLGQAPSYADIGVGVFDCADWYADASDV